MMRPPNKNLSNLTSVICANLSLSKKDAENLSVDKTIDIVLERASEAMAINKSLEKPEKPTKECAGTVSEPSSVSRIPAELDKETIQSPNRVNRLTVRKDISKVPLTVEDSAALSKLKTPETESQAIDLTYSLKSPIVVSESSSLTSVVSPCQTVSRISVRTDITKRIALTKEKSYTVEKKPQSGNAVVQNIGKMPRLDESTHDPISKPRLDRTSSLSSDNQSLPKARQERSLSSGNSILRKTRWDSAIAVDDEEASSPCFDGKSLSENKIHPKPRYDKTSLDSQVTAKSQLERLITQQSTPKPRYNRTTTDKHVPNKSACKRNNDQEKPMSRTSLVTSHTRSDRRILHSIKTVTISPIKKKINNFIKCPNVKKYRPIQPANSSAAVNKGSFEKVNKGPHFRHIAPTPGLAIISSGVTENKNDKPTEPSDSECSLVTGNVGQPSEISPSKTLIFPGASLASNSLVSALFPGADFSKNIQFSNKDQRPDKAGELGKISNQMANQKKKIETMKVIKKKISPEQKRKKVIKDKKEKAKDRQKKISKPTDIIDLCEDSHSVPCPEPSQERQNTETISAQSRNDPSFSSADSSTVEQSSTASNAQSQPTKQTTSDLSTLPSDIPHLQPLMATFVPQPLLPGSSRPSHIYSSVDANAKAGGSSRPYHYKPHNRHFQRDRKFHKKKYSSWHTPTQNY